MPLAATPHFRNAAPISGMASFANVEFEFDMRVDRVAEHPRITKPFSDESWTALDALGDEVDRVLKDKDVRLTMGGEPTFVSIDDFEADEWNTAAVGPTKREKADTLIRRLRERFAPGGFLHYGQGKWYPGEIAAALDLLALLARRRRAGLERPGADRRRKAERQGRTPRTRATLLTAIADELGVSSRTWCAEAYEDPAEWLLKEGKLPDNVDPANSKLEDPEERSAHGACVRARPDQPDRLRAAGAALERRGLRPALALGEMEDAARQAVPGARAIRPVGYRLPLGIAALCAAGAVPLYRPGRSVGAARRAAGAR